MRPSLGRQIAALEGLSLTGADGTAIEAALETLRTVAKTHEAGGYVLARVTPGWKRIRIVDAATGELIDRVIEANEREGWIVQIPEPRALPVRVDRHIRIEPLTDGGAS